MIQPRLHHYFYYYHYYIIISVSNMCEEAIVLQGSICLLILNMGILLLMSIIPKTCVQFSLCRVVEAESVS